MSPNSKVWGVLLACNVVGIALGMVERDARWVEYVNLFGVVLFGHWLASA